MPAAPAPPTCGASPAAGRGTRWRTRPAWPVAIVFALAALSWGALSLLPVATPASDSRDATHLVSSSTSETQRDAIVPSARASIVSVLRVAPDALAGGPEARTLVGWTGIVTVLVAATLIRDARQRWWARLVGAPPVLDVHLV